MDKTPSFLTINEEMKLAYHKNYSDNYSDKPTVIFLGGLMSDMKGTKACFLEEFCAKHHYNFIRFDYLGHGESSGAFTDGTISIWKDNALTIIDQITEGDILLVGSSLGGWVGTLATIERPERIKAFIGIAAAPDFTKGLMWDQFSDDIKHQLHTAGVYEMPSEYDDGCAYPITLKLIEDGNQNLVLGPEELPITCPVRLIHGMVDSDVPFDLSIRLAQKIASTNTTVTLVKDGDHRMSHESTLNLIGTQIKELMNHLLLQS